MAKLMLIGTVADIELTTDPDDGQVIATCTAHVIAGRDFSTDELVLVGCGWAERYDDLGDASEYAADHADRGD